MKSFLEWYLGIPPAQPGQGTQWSWLYETPWPSWMPQWSVLLLGLLVVLYIGCVYRRDAAATSVWSRCALAGLRLAVIACVLVILTDLTLIVDRTGLPFVAVLIDDSASMGLEDRYPEPDSRRAADTLHRASGNPEPSRLSIAQGLLTADEGRFLRQLQNKHQLRVYRFSGTASPIAGFDDSGSGVGPLIEAIRGLEADGEETRPAQAIRKVLNDFRGSLPTAIIALTDGISSR